MIVNEFNFKKLLSQALNPYVVTPEANTASVSDADKFDISEIPEEQIREQLAVNVLGMPMEFPLEIKSADEDWWLLPFEPIITVTGKNIIVKKQVSKGKVRGTIKERWSQDDYSISIEGLLMNTYPAYPSDDVQRLRRYCESAQLQVRCPLFELFSINQIVVDSFDFPKTTGIANQVYRISASSDDIYQLLLKKEDLKKM